jgi:hypothetical protein
MNDVEDIEEWELGASELGGIHVGDIDAEERERSTPS